MSDAFGIGACRPAVKKVAAASPPAADALPLEAAIVIAPSSSSLAGRLRLPLHISSRRFGGLASIGARLSTEPIEGRSHDRPPLPKPRSSSCAARTARAEPEEA